jgi:hypothetical protein
VSAWKFRQWFIFLFPLTASPIHIKTYNDLELISLISEPKFRTAPFIVIKLAKARALDFSNNAVLSILNSDGAKDLVKQISKFNRLSSINFSNCCLFNLYNEVIEILGRRLSFLNNVEELNFSNNFSCRKESQKLECLISSLLINPKLSFSRIILTGNFVSREAAESLKDAGFTKSSLKVWERN